MDHLYRRLSSSIDLLLCNPPYVATVEEEAGSSDISAAWAGGKFGLNVTKEVIDSLHDLLSDNGAAYIVLEQCNKPDEVRSYVEELKLFSNVILERRAGREYLIVLKISKN